MTHKDLVMRSHLSPRTVRYAIRILKENNLIVEKFNFRDARRIIYLNKEQWAQSQLVRQQAAGPYGVMQT